MNIVDSSGWLEFFADGKNASFFEPPILKPVRTVWREFTGNCGIV